MSMLQAAAGGAALRRGAALCQAVAFTLLNPHVYLDTVLLVGSIGAQQPAPLQGWFAAGASRGAAEKKPLPSGFFSGLKGSLARTFGTVEPIGEHEQAKDHEHDDEDVFDFHGFSLGWG